MSFFGLTAFGSQNPFQLHSTAEKEALSETVQRTNNASTSEDIPDFFQLTKGKHSGTKTVSSEFTSFEKMKEARSRQELAENGPREKYLAPLTTNQQIGWLAREGHERRAAMPDRYIHRPKKTTDVTQFMSEVLKTGHA